MLRKSNEFLKHTISELNENMFLHPKSDNDRIEIAEYVGDKINGVTLAIGKLRKDLVSAEKEMKSLSDSLGKSSTKLSSSILKLIDDAYQSLDDAGKLSFKAEQGVDAVIKSIKE